MMNNIPEVKLGLVAVSRDCFPITLSEKRRAAIKEAYKGELYECPVTVENEKDMEKAVAAGVSVLVSKAGPTADAVSLARTYGLTLIGCAREDSFAVF